MVGGQGSLAHTTSVRKRGLVGVGVDSETASQKTAAAIPKTRCSESEKNGPESKNAALRVRKRCGGFSGKCFREIYSSTVVAA